MSPRAVVALPSPHWAEEGRLWCLRARHVIGALALDVDHVGSTAVPGLAAKDVIDIQALVFDLDEGAEISAALAGAGWREDVTKRIEPRRPGYPQHQDHWDRLYFNAPEGERAVALHVREAGAANARIALLLRDFLRADSLAREQYHELKLGLAQHVNGLEAYSALKRPWVAVTLRLAEAWAERTRWRPGASDG